MNQATGSRLFRFRRFYYLIPVFLGVTAWPQFRFLYRSYIADEIFEVFCFLVLFFGFSIRFIASGSSLRSFRIRDSESLVRSEALSSTGIFSLWRHPHFFGDLVIITGLALLSQNFKVLAASLLCFLACYSPILIRKEKLIKKDMGAAYEAYQKNTGLIFPSFKNWKRAKVRFHMKAALYKEGGVLVYLIFLFVFLDVLRDSLISKKLLLNYYWTALALLALLVWGIHHRKTLLGEAIDPQEWPE